MSNSNKESADIFAECRKNAARFFEEIDKSTPVYHQTATDIQKQYLDAWKNVIEESIALQKELAAKSGVPINTNEETVTAIQNMTEYAITAYQNQNKIVLDSAETSQKIFDMFNENTQTFSSLNKNMVDFMTSFLKSRAKN